MVTTTLFLLLGEVMPKRFKVKHKHSAARKFAKSAHRTKGMNLRLMPMRGGFRA